MSLRNKITGIRALWAFDNRWQLIFNRIFFKNSGLLAYKIGNMEFLVDHDAGDHNGTRLCLISDIYTRFLPMMQLPNPLTVFDLGANGGGFPLMLLLNEFQISKLVCVEMNPNTFRRLSYNMTRNVRCETDLVPAAVCGNRKTLQLRLGSGDISDSIYQEPKSNPDKTNETYDIPGYSFDELFRSHFGEQVVDLCKMDIEGAEYEVLSSPGHSCLGFCRYLIVELHPASADTQNKFSTALSAMGFVEVADDERNSQERLYRNENVRK